MKQDELDIHPPGGGGGPRTFASTKGLIEAHDKAVEEARKAVAKATDKFLQTPWKLLAGGQVAQQNARYLWILDNFKHLAHHRGQLTVYLRMTEQKVPAIYGPSADDQRF